MSEKLDALIRRMKEDPSNERVAFKTLAERPDLANFLEPLRKAGLFDPSRNPNRRPAEQEGYFVIPYWSALDYLERVAEHAERPENRRHAETLLQIIREITEARGAAGVPADNYHTWHSFAKILALLPVDMLTTDAMGMLSVWLSSRFDRGLIGSVIGEKLLPRILVSGAPNKCGIAEDIVSTVTRLEKRERNVGSRRITEWGAAVSAYHLDKLLKRNARSLGELCGRSIVEVLLKRTSEWLRNEEDRASYWLRPAIEDHEQNRHRDQTFNSLVTALRDVVLGWASTNVRECQATIKGMLRSRIRLHRRVALHVVDRMYDQLDTLFWKEFKSMSFVDLELRHELYWLLKNNFQRFNTKQQKRLVSTIEDIRGSWRDDIPVAERGRLDSRLKRDWFDAIKGQGNSSVDQRYQELTASVGPVSKHPDLIAYSETRTGPGPSPFTRERLMEEDCESLVALLNEFEEEKAWDWDKPTLRALVDVLIDTVRQKPEKFIGCLTQLRGLRIPYKYALVEGLRRALNEHSDASWSVLMDFLRLEIGGRQIWDVGAEKDEERSGLMNPTINWLVSSASDFVAEIVKKDNIPLEPKFLDDALDLVNTVLQKLPPEPDSAESNPLDHAINTPRGRAIEALFACALRVARDKDRIGVGHETTWVNVLPIVTRELSKTKNGSNTEFLAICGSLLPQLAYLNREWLDENISIIFSFESLENFRAAIVGFSYVNVFQKEVYLLLRKKGVLDHALKQEFAESHVREKLLQFISVAYLNDDESLENKGGLFRTVIDNARADDLVEITGFLWVQHAELASNPGFVKRVLEYWAYCSTMIKGREEQFSRVLSKLCVLAEYLSDLNAESVAWLSQAAPYVDEDHNSTFLLRELKRLVPKHPEAGGKIVAAMFERYRPIYQDNEVVELVRTLYEAGQKFIANSICDKLRDYPRIRELYAQFNH